MQKKNTFEQMLHCIDSPIQTKKKMQITNTSITPCYLVLKKKSMRLRK